MAFSCPSRSDTGITPGMLLIWAALHLCARINTNLRWGVPRVVTVCTETDTAPKEQPLRTNPRQNKRNGTPVNTWGLPQDPSHHGKRLGRPSHGGRTAALSTASRRPETPASAGGGEVCYMAKFATWQSLLHYVHGAPGGQQCPPGNGIAPTYRGRRAAPPTDDGPVSTAGDAGGTNRARLRPACSPAPVPGPLATG